MSTMGESSETAPTTGKVDFHQVASFIEKNFGSAGADKKFSVEHVGQYFASKPLSQLQAHSQRAWLFQLKEMLIDAPDGGVYGEVFCIIEEATYDGSTLLQEDLEVTFANRADGMGQLEEALAWLVANKLVKDEGGPMGSAFCLATSDVTAASAHSLLYPDRVGDSLVQIFEDLRGRIETLFTAPGQSSVAKGRYCTLDASIGPLTLISQPMRSSVLAIGSVCSESFECVNRVVIVDSSRQVSDENFFIQRWSDGNSEAAKAANIYDTAVVVGSRQNDAAALHFIKFGFDAASSSVRTTVGGIDLGSSTIQRVQSFSGDSIVVLVKDENGTLVMFCR